MDTLHSMDCPVVVVPEQFNVYTINILGYNGTASSVFAIKQFIYLFPELLKMPTILAYVKEDQSIAFPDQSYVQELLVCHFADLDFFKLDADPYRDFAAWINEKKGALLVTGSYERSALSQLIKKSFVTDVILGHQLPVFIAHK